MDVHHMYTYNKNNNINLKSNIQCTKRYEYNTMDQRSALYKEH